MIRLLYRKLKREIKELTRLARYPFLQGSIISRLEKEMPCVSIETTNICNANCIFCAYQYQSRPTGIMEKNIFQGIIDQYDDFGGGNINLTPTVGDPLCDPLVIQRIQYAKSKKNIKVVGLYSNLILLDRVTAEALVDSGLDSLTVSMSGFDPEMYRRLYRSNEYERVLKNLYDFISANQSKGWPVGFLIDMRVDSPLREVVRADEFQTIAGMIGVDRINIKFRYDDWHGKISPGQLQGNMKLRKTFTLRKPRISPCSELFSGPMIYWDGRVGACGCRDFNASELIIGNIKQDNIVDIWFGPEIKRLRREFLTRNIQPICRDCGQYNNLSRKV